MRRRLDLKGQKYGMLLVQKFAGMSDKSRSLWQCICDCGVVKVLDSNSIRSGKVKSCGCKSKKHLLSATPTYTTWARMKYRCTNKKDKDYKYYGQRGITVCERWLLSFENFYRDMGERPEGMTLDRIDVNKGYCLENCRWASQEQQVINRRKSSSNTSGFVGVTKNGDRWGARIQVKGKQIYIGTYDSPTQAALARNDYILENDLSYPLDKI